MKPLEGIRVLDFTHVLAGPYATMILGDLGAEVIKIERPKIGDDSRGFGPYKNGESAYFANINRDKYGIVLDLKKEEAKEIVRELVKKSDVVIENFRPGTMEKLGFSYEEFSRINPKIIYVSISGFGKTGLYKDRPGYDMIVQAFGGIMSITGPEGGPPVRVGTSVGDITAALFASIGILSALVVRDKTGKGQFIDVAMLDCQLAILENAIMRYYIAGEIPGPLGTRHPSIVPFQAFRAKDDWIVIAVGNDHLWGNFCRAVGREELIDDPRFKTNPKRLENYKILKPIIDEIISQKTVDEWLKIFLEAEVPSTRINTIDRTVNDPHVKARGILQNVKHPVIGDMLIPKLPIMFSETPVDIERPAPLLGQHSEKVLSEILGYDKGKIEELKQKEILG